MGEKERLRVESLDQWRNWLAENHQREQGVWLVTFKKHIKDRYVPRDDLIEEARDAARRHDIELTVRLTHSDQETLYAFRRMSRDIDGFWLFPDSRVLSARALREMAEIAERNRVRFAVPNEGMLALGAAVALTTVASDIAAVIADVLDRMQRDEAAGVPRLSGLREIDVKAGGTVADTR